MNGLYLFARIAGTAVAIRTDEIEAVVRLHELSPVPGVPAHVAGLSALRSRVLTIIDAAVLVCGPSARREAEADAMRYAIVCDISGHTYGITVDGVDDIQNIEGALLPVCGKVEPAWEPYAREVINHNGEAHFVIPISAFLDGFASAQAA